MTTETRKVSCIDGSRHRALEAVAVAAERARLRVVFKRYGAHDHDCPAEMPSPFTGKDQGCWCGLVETWAAFPERPPSCPDHPEDY